MREGENATEELLTRRNSHVRVLEKHVLILLHDRNAILVSFFLPAKKAKEREENRRVKRADSL